MDKPMITMRSIFGDRSPAHRRRGVKAWLLEWVASPFDAKKVAGTERDSTSAEIAGVLSPRLTWQAAYDVAKAIYFAQRVEPAVMLAFRDAKPTEVAPFIHEAGRMEASPFVAMFPFSWEQRLFPNNERVFRGHYFGWLLIAGNPGLYARLVENLRADQERVLHWTEREAPLVVPWPEGQGR